MTDAAAPTSPGTSPGATSGALTAGEPSVLRVTWVIALRGLRRMRRRPSLFIPTVIMPTFFVITFTGSFSGITDVPGYGTDNAFNWMTAYAILQGASFAGVGAAGMTAEDIENGFFDRMLLAPGPRWILLLGPIVYSIVRSAIPSTIVLLVAFVVGGADMPGGALGILMVYLAAAGTSVVFGLLAINVVYVGRSQRSLLAVQVPVFGLLFLSTGQVPLSFQTGWLHAVASVNPVTKILETARQGFLGEVTWSATWPGLTAIAVLASVLSVLAVRRLRSFAP